MPASVSLEPLLRPTLYNLDLQRIDWVIVGGESVRERVRWIRAGFGRFGCTCRDQKVPFFFKQCGGVSKKRTGRFSMAERGKNFRKHPKNRLKRYVWPLP